MKDLDRTPYYAVIFSSHRNEKNTADYEKMAEQMVTLAKQQRGYLGVESVRDSEGSGITVSYWQTMEDIKAWKTNSEHLVAQEFGRSDWYSSYRTRICLVEREYDFDAGEKR